MGLLPGVKQKGLERNGPFLVMLSFAGGGCLVRFPCTLALPQGSPVETAPSMWLVHRALGGWKKQNCGHSVTERYVCMEVTYTCTILKEMANLECVYKEKAQT